MPRLNKEDIRVAIGGAQVKRRGRRYVPKHTDPIRGDSGPAQTDADIALEEAAPAWDASAPTVDPNTPPKKTKEQVEAASYTSDGDVLDIWSRRMLNPDGVASPEITLKVKGMRLRWINLSARGRYQRARKEQGWTPVLKTMLVDEREIYGVSYTSEGWVCRGEKQQEMLMMMPQAIYKKIQKMREQIIAKSYETLRQQMASAGSNHFTDKYGASAGQVAADAAGQFKGNISFGREEVTTDDLLS